MNMMDELLLMELEQAETDEEKHNAIVKILKHRPALKSLMQDLIYMEQKEQDQEIHLYTEALKPHTVSM